MSLSSVLSSYTPYMEMVQMLAITINTEMLRNQDLREN